MTDYGLRRGRTPLGAQIALGLFAAVAVGGVASFLITDYRLNRQEAIATAQSWSIAGRACPQITRAAYLSRERGSRPIEHFGMQVVRENGHVSCAMVTNDGGRGWGSYPVCQFTSPASLHVKTAKGEWWFEPGHGVPVTLSAPGGEAKCVMDAKFRMDP